jgi:hypothetical protein
MSSVISLEGYVDQYPEDDEVALKYEDRAYQSIVTKAGERREEDWESKHISKSKHIRTPPPQSPGRRLGRMQDISNAANDLNWSLGQASIPSTVTRRSGATRSRGYQDDTFPKRTCGRPTSVRPGTLNCIGTSNHKDKNRYLTRSLSRNSSLNSPSLVSKHELIKNAHSWRQKSHTLEIGVQAMNLGIFQVGQLVWIGSPTNMNGSILLEHEDFRPPSDAWNHLALLYAKYNAIEGDSCFECLKITSYSNCEKTEERTMAAVKWSQEVVPRRRLLYLPIVDDHPATIPEHEALKMPVLTFETGDKLEKTSYVNVERTFVIEEKFLGDNLAQRTVLSKESMRVIKKYRRDRKYEGIFDPETGKPITLKDMRRQLDSKRKDEDRSYEIQGKIRPTA